MVGPDRSRMAMVTTQGMIKDPYSHVKDDTKEALCWNGLMKREVHMDIVAASGPKDET